MTRESARRSLRLAAAATVAASLTVFTAFAPLGAQPGAPPAARGSGSAIEGPVRDVASGRPLAHARLQVVDTATGGAVETKKLGNTVATIDASELKNAPIANPSVLLAARSPGVSVM